MGDAEAPAILPSEEPVHPALKTTRARLVLAFAAVYVLWGSTYFAIRIGIETLPPFILAGMRHLFAGAILYSIARLRTGEQPTRANWTSATVIGALLLLGGNGGVCWSEQIVPSGVTALLVATVSLWMVIIEWLRPRGTRPTWRVTAGLVLGFGGLVLLAGPSHLGGERVNLLGAAVLVLASLSWATGSVYSKHSHLPHDPLLGTGMASLAGGILLFLASLATGEAGGMHWRAVSLHSELALVYLIVFGSIIAFTAYTWLLRVAPPARVATYAFVNPVVAMFLGWAFAGEPVTLRTLLASAAILAAVILVITSRQRAVVVPRDSSQAIESVS